MAGTGRLRPVGTGSGRVRRLLVRWYQSTWGVWVPGPGTVWLDDLSLREFIPAPLELILDQEHYDSQDHVGVLSVSVNKPPSPAELQFTLAGRGGTEAPHLAASLAEAAEKGQVSITVSGGAMLLASPALDRSRKPGVTTTPGFSCGM